jgi:hypothetical protein
MQNKVRAAIVVFVILTGMVLSFGKPHLAHATDMSDVFNISDGYIQQDGVYIDESPETYSNGAKFKLRINLHGDSGTPKPAIDKQITGPLHGQFDSADTFNDWDSILDSDLEKSSDNGIFFIIAKKKVVNNTNTDFVLTDGANYTVMGLAPDEQPPLGYTHVESLLLGIQGGQQTVSQLANSMQSIRNIGGILWRIGDPAQYFFNVIKFAPILSVTGLEPDTTYYARIVLSEDNSSNIFTTKQIVEFKTKPAGDPIGTAETSGSVGTPESETEKSGITYGGLDIFCVRFDGLSFQVSPAGCVAMLFQEALVPLSSLIANATGHLFDAFAAVSLGSTIYGQGQSGHNIALFVENSWSIVRDIANIFFIFILLYAALGLVLSLHHFDAKKLVAQTIIIALIINFSLFFCRVTVDASNILSRVFYNAMSISATGNYQTTIQKEVSEQPISAAITGSIQPQKLLGPESLGKVKNVTVASIIMILLLVFVLNLVLAWIFFMCAAFFAGRIGVIWFSMIFAPLAFVSSIVPSLDKNLKQLGWHNWLSGFMKACFNAPIFFFFLYMITNLVGNGDGGLLQTTVAAVTSAGNGGLTNWITFLVAILLPAMIVVGLLIAAKGIAEEMAGQFGAAFAGIVAAGTGLVAMGVTGGAAVVARGSVGAIAARISSPQSAIGNKLRDKATGSGFGSFMARQGVKLAAGGKKASFDIRQTGLGNALSKATGVDMDIGTKIPLVGGLTKSFSTEHTAGGFEGKAMRQAKSEREFADMLGFDKNKADEIAKVIKEKEKNISKQEDIIEELQGLVQTAKANGGKITEPYTDPVTGKKIEGQELANIDQKKIQEQLNQQRTNLRKLKKGGDSTDPTQVWTEADTKNPQMRKADGSAVTKQDIGKLRTENIGLEDLKKAQETNKKARVNEYYNRRIEQSSGEIAHPAERDVLGNIKTLAHGTGKVAVAKWLKNFINDAGAGAAMGGIGGLLVAGLPGAVTGAVGFGLARALRNLSFEETIGNFRYEAAHLASDADHKIHLGHSTYKSPGSGFTDMFKGFSGGGGGGHGGGGHDDHGGGHDDHGGGGHH